jgi:hypothetical protein
MVSAILSYHPRYCRGGSNSARCQGTQDSCLSQNAAGLSNRTGLISAPAAQTGESACHGERCTVNARFSDRNRKREVGQCPVIQPNVLSTIGLRTMHPTEVYREQRFRSRFVGTTVVRISDAYSKSSRRCLRVQQRYTHQLVSITTYCRKLRSLNYLALRLITLAFALFS